MIIFVSSCRMKSSTVKTHCLWNANNGSCPSLDTPADEPKNTAVVANWARNYILSYKAAPSSSTRCPRDTGRGASVLNTCKTSSSRCLTKQKPVYS